MDPEDAVESTLRLQKCLHSFIDHVDALKYEDDPSGDGFTREFRVIRDQGIREKEINKYPAEEGRRPINIRKNRYKDILPFDDTRVTLNELPGEEGSDYINANFIQDQYGTKCYIASQGPVQNTVYDFWRMVLQYRVKVVAMACRLVEMGKKKCEQYWPDTLHETTEFKDISVTLLSQEDLGEHCTKRVFKASRAGGEPETLTQFHYTGWPDHDIPNDFDVILEMMAEMREIKTKDTQKAPMVIHCSAGCGRTGTMIAIDYVWDLLKSGKLDGTFNLNEIVQFMRTQRQSMIQAPEQYMMAHITVQKLFQMHLDLMEDHTYGNIGFNAEDGGSEKPDGSGSEAGSEASSGLYEAIRKKSVMEQDIAKTVQKVTHAPTADELLTPTNPTPFEAPGLQEPLTPTPAVYVVPTDSGGSSSIKDLKDTFSEDSNKDTKTFKVEKIDNIPSNEVKMRYLGNISKSEFSEKKLSFISNEARQKDLESKKAMFEKPKLSEKPLVQPQKSLDKPKPVMSTSTKEMNNNQPVNSARSGSFKGMSAKPSANTDRPTLKRIESQQVGDKHVTVLSVGGGATKPLLGKAVSVPTQPVVGLQSNAARSKTLPNKGNPFQDPPQSSIPPDARPSQTGSIYSSPGNSQFYSSLSDYSSAVPKTDTKEVSDDHYSALADYSSANGIQPKNEYSYSVATENKKDVTGSKPGQATSNVYSYAVEPEADSVYTAVNKPMKATKTTNGAVSEDTYETVHVGKVSDKAPPAIPTRGYVEEENGKQDAEKSGAGDLSTSGRKAQLTSAIKNLFGGKNTSSSDHVVPSDIPGYKQKIGKKPGGPKDQPVTWKKK